MSDNDRQSPLQASTANAPMLSHAAWVRILPFLAYMAFIVVADLRERLGVSASALRWLYPVKIFTVVVTLVICWRYYTELHSIRLTPIGAGIAVLVGLAVFALWISLSSGWMLIGSPAGFDPRTNGQVDWLLVGLRIAGAALVVPVMEELFWRSFLLRWLDNSNFESVDPAKVRLSSVAIAAVLFGFEHNLWLAGIVAGAAYSVLYMRARSLWPAIVAHGVTNGILGLWIVRTAQWTFW
ncbi:CAAX prenyl protease-related protein [Massilia sp. TSP1-1-2]|uniref:CAAX prenyl protease-related protein n=1 Tax=unclassified Massilia TaxID=2609279 RepID=UPI003CEEE462